MEDVKLILPTSWQPNRVSFFEALGIEPKGLGAQLFGSVFDSFFTHSVELKREYLNYYSVEYSTLREYIEIRYGETMSDDELEKENIFLIRYLPQIVDTMYEDNKLDTVLECVEKMEEAYENKT